MTDKREWAEVLAGPLVERWGKRARKFHGRHEYVECADELLAHLRESGVVELLAKQEQALEQISKIKANVLDHYSWKAQAEAYRIAFSELQGIVCETLAAKAKLLGKGADDGTI